MISHSLFKDSVFSSQASQNTSMLSPILSLSFLPSSRTMWVIYSHSPPSTNVICQTVNNTDPFLSHLHSLLAYSHAHRGVLKLRDQKQLDLEELTEYLSNVVIERDRLSSIIAGRPGTTSQGIGAYLKERVDAIRGGDDDRSRVEKMRKLDTKIKEVRSIDLHGGGL